MSTGIEAAIAAAIAFLRERQRPDGELPLLRWRDDPARAWPEPAVFATALIACSLANVTGAEDVRERALRFITSHMERHGVWRHWTPGHPKFRHIPPDADDTSVASLALLRNGRPAPPNREVLLANRNARGLFFTWITPRPRWGRSLAWSAVALAQLRHPLANVLFLRRGVSRRNDVDAVVNANVLSYLGCSPATEPVVRDLLQILREHRESACDKWYDSPFSIWYFFSRALRTVPSAEGGAMLVERVRGAAPSNALERALAACTLLDWNAPADEAIEAILREQQRSGAWASAPLYHGGPARWGSDALTTGFCIEALSRRLEKK